MKLDVLIEKLTAKRTVLKDVYFAYIRPAKEWDILPFHHEHDLDRFANSTEENQEQIILKFFNGKKSFFISMISYDAIVVDDGDNIRLTSFWAKREPQRIEDIEPDLEKAKDEIVSFFSTVETKKLAS